VLFEIGLRIMPRWWLRRLPTDHRGWSKHQEGLAAQDRVREEAAALLCSRVKV